MSDALPNIIAQMRRLYQHMQSGGHITGPDLGRQIEKLEVLQTSVEQLTEENYRLRAWITEMSAEHPFMALAGGHLPTRENTNV